MKRKAKPKKKQVITKKRVLGEALSLYSEAARLRDDLHVLEDKNAELEQRLHDTEVNLSLIIRLLTTLCIEKFGMRVGVLKRLIKKAEQDAIRDSQIMELESLYKMPQQPKKKKKARRKKAKEDPWDEIT